MADRPPVVHARFRIRLPGDAWIEGISRRHSTATFRLLTGVRRETDALELGEVRADDPETPAAAVGDHESVRGYRRLEDTAERVVARYETTDTSLYDFLADVEIAPSYPIVVRNGWFEHDVTGSREAFDRFRDRMRDADRPFELISIVEDREESELLSARQREVLEVALRRGYLNVPRDCTLADVGDAVGVDKSTASELIRRAEAKIVRWYLTRPTGTRERA